MVSGAARRATGVTRTTRRRACSGPGTTAPTPPEASVHVVVRCPALVIVSARPEQCARRQTRRAQEGATSSCSRYRRGPADVARPEIGTAAADVVAAVADVPSVVEPRVTTIARSPDGTSDAGIRTDDGTRPGRSFEATTSPSTETFQRSTFVFAAGFVHVTVTPVRVRTACRPVGRRTGRTGGASSSSASNQTGAEGTSPAAVSAVTV